MNSLHFILTLELFTLSTHSVSLPILVLHLKRPARVADAAKRAAHNLAFSRFTPSFALSFTPRLYLIDIILVKMIAKVSFHRQGSPPGPRSPRSQPRPLHFVAFVVVILFASSRFLNCMETQDKQPRSTEVAKQWLVLDENEGTHQIRLLKDEWQKARSTARKDCGSLPFKRNDYYEFNISSNTGNEFRLLDRTSAEAREILQGTIDVIPGDLFQRSDIDMRIETLSNSKDDLNNLHINESPSALDMEYSFENQDDICTKVNVLLFLRPSIKIDVFDVWTTFLGVSFYNDLNVEIDNLNVHSSHGDPDMNNRLSLEPLIVHNMSVSSIDGDIFSE